LKRTGLDRLAEARLVSDEEVEAQETVQKLIREGVLPATQLMPSAPWQIPVAALKNEPVKTGAREIVGRRPKFYKRFEEDTIHRRVERACRRPAFPAAWSDAP
jgi:hypothetical protein